MTTSNANDSLVLHRKPAANTARKNEAGDVTLNLSKDSVSYVF